MALRAGSYKLGHATATLRVRTRRGGAASRAGHDLLIEVTGWDATLDVMDDGAGTSIELSADPRSLKVLEGTGGVLPLGDSDRAGISQTIDEEVLKGAPIQFRSTGVQAGARGGARTVSGELELGGQRHPIAFDLVEGDGGRLTATARFKQSDWGIKPYSALFGTLKVNDEVTVEFAAQLPEGAHESARES